MTDLPPEGQPIPPPVTAPPVSNVPPGDYSAPPPAYAAYYRPVGFGGTPEKLEALAKGYYGLNWAFLFTIVWTIGGIGAIVGLAPKDIDPALGGGLVLVFLAITIPVVALISYKPVKNIAFGMDWPRGRAILISVLMGIGVMFVGIIAFIVMQIIAAGEIRRYPVRTSFLGGFRKKDVRAAVEAMRASGQFPTAPETPSAGRFQP